MLESPLRFISIVASILIVCGWLAFAIDQTRDGSQSSQQGIADTAVTTTAPAKVHHGPVRRQLDRVDHALLAPFRGIVSASAGDWVRHSVPALLGLLAYGFGVGYLARFTRGRA